MNDRCWSVRPVKGGHGWLHQAAIYERSSRRDGLPIWKFIRAVGPADYVEGKAKLQGQTTGLLYDPAAKHNGTALTIQDFMPPEEETICRIHGRDFLLVGAPARNEKRKIIGLAQRDGRGARWVFTRRIGSISAKQVRLIWDIGAKFKMRWAWIDAMPRMRGKELDIEWKDIHAL